MGLAPVAQTIHYKGEFDYQAFYSLLHDYFGSRGYDFAEVRYKDKGDEYEVEWEGERDYDGLHAVTFKLSYHAWDVDRIRVERSGKPVTHVKARIQIKMSAQVERYTQNDHGQTIFNQKSKLDQFFMKIYDKVTDREEDEYWEDEVTGPLIIGLAGTLKSFFGMQDG